MFKAFALMFLALTPSPQTVSYPDFLAAVKANDVAQVKVYLQQEINPNFILENEVPLTVAAQTGSLEMVTLLLNSQASVFLRPDLGYPLPVHVAAQRGDLNILKKLIEAGSSVNASVRGTKRVIDYAILGGSTQVYTYLKQLQAFPGDKITDDLAAGCDSKDQMGRVNLVETLASDHTDFSHQELIQQMIAKDCDLLIGALVKAGVSIQEKNQDGQTPLAYYLTPANFYHKVPSKSALYALINAGADLNQADLKDTNLNLGYFLGDLCDPAITDAMLAHGLLKSTLTDALYPTIKAANLSFFDYLIAKGADPSNSMLQVIFSNSLPLFHRMIDLKISADRCPGYKSDSSCLWAAIMGDYNRPTSDEMLLEVLKAGADPKGTGEFNWHHERPTAFGLAVFLKRFTVADYILAHGFDINYLDEDKDSGLSALHFLSRSCEEQTPGDCAPTESLDYLAKHHPDANIKDKQGNPVLFQMADLTQARFRLFVDRFHPDFNATDAEGRNVILHIASFGYDFDQKIAYLAKLTDINHLDNDGNGVVEYARYSLDRVKLLVSLGAKLEIPDKDGKTLLMLAASDYKQDFLNFLIEQKVNLNLTDKDGADALILAIQYHDLQNALLLVNAGIKLNQTYQSAGELNWLLFKLHDNSVDNDFTTLFKAMVEHGASLNTLNAAHQSPFYIFCLNNPDHIEFIRYLLDHGADINTSDSDGVSVLMQVLGKSYWSDQSRTDIITELLKRGVKLEAEDKRKKTALFYAQNVNDLNQLLEAKVEVNHLNIDGLNAFSSFMGGRILSEENEPYLLALLSAGSNPNLNFNPRPSDSFRQNSYPIQAALAYQVFPLFQALIKANADLSVLGNLGENLLFYSADAATTQILLSQGVAKDFQTEKYGITPLMNAAREGNLEVVKVLLNAKVDAKKVDSRGRTALSYADTSEIRTLIQDYLNQQTAL